MNCSEMIELIARRIEGALSEEDAKALDAHLLECSACRAELRFQQKIEECLKVPPAVALSSDFGARVARRALAQAHAEKRERRLGYLLPIAANAIALTLVILYRGAVAEALAPTFSSLGAAARSTITAVGAAFPQASAQAIPSGSHVIQVLGIFGPIACAGAILVIASSRIFALRRG